MKKTDNTSPLDKKAIRDWVLVRAGGKKATVLELFGGDGVMYDMCYTKVAKHLAFDIKAVHRDDWLQGNNRVLLPKYVNDGWSVYDADAYGSPWGILTDVCRLRGKGKFYFVATCVIGRTLATGRMPADLRQLTGYNKLPLCPLLARVYPDLLRVVFRRWAEFGVKVLQGKFINTSASGLVRYFAFELNKG